MRKKLNLLLGLVFIISMAAPLTGCGGSEKQEKNYEGKWVAVSAQMMGISVSVDETFGGDFEFEVKNGPEKYPFQSEHYRKWKWSVEMIRLP